MSGAKKQGQARVGQLDVALRLRQAMDAHRQNKFTEAERAYRAVLDTAPDCFEALHFLGLAYLQQNKFPEALDLVSRALKARPQSADSLAMRGVVLSNLGRYAEALQSQDALLALRPDSAETHYNRGVSLGKLERHEEAVASYRKSIALKADNPQAFHNLGNSLIELGRPQEALDAYEGTIRHAKTDTLVNRGGALLELKRPQEALESYDLALARDQGHIAAMMGRGRALAALERHQDALACYERIIDRDPENLDALVGKIRALIRLDRPLDVLACSETALAVAPDRLDFVNTRGEALQQLGRFDEALANAQRALALDSKSAPAHLNLGNALNALGRYDEAEVSFRQAIALSPELSGAHRNLGSALLSLEQFDSALNVLDRAIELSPKNEGTLTNRSLVYLGLGDFERGWADYHDRFTAADRKADWRNYKSPLWDGAATDGPLLVWGEQGVGDQILYGSMIPDLVQRVPRIVLELDRRLVPLFARSFPTIDVIPVEKTLCEKPSAAHMPIGTLGKFLRRSWDDFPHAPGGFLKADPEQASALRARLKTDDRLVVGISWRSANKQHEKAKSAGLHAFAPLLELPNCRFVDMQYGDTSAERDAVARDIGVRVEHLDDIDNMNDIDGLASLITACDLVVTVSNTTAHLAGALGKETYVLVPFGQARMWYWFHDRLDSPFYPDIKIRRQTRTHDWAPVIGSLAAEIGTRGTR